MNVEKSCPQVAQQTKRGNAAPSFFDGFSGHHELRPAQDIVTIAIVRVLGSACYDLRLP
jgi:hypothetical protein